NVRNVPITVIRPDVDLVVTAASADAKFVPGASTQVTYSVANHGHNPTTSGSWKVGVYLADSPGQGFDPSKVVRTYQAGKLLQLGSFTHTGNLASLPASGVDDSSNSYTESQTITIPSNVPIAPKYLVIVADPANHEAERDDGYQPSDANSVQ